MFPEIQNKDLLKKLIARIIKGDQSAFTYLYNSIANKMYAVCLANTNGCRRDAEDCLQDGFMHLYRGIGSYAFKGSFEGWARSIFLNCCLDYSRINSRSPSSTGIQAAWKMQDNYATPIENLYVKDILKAVDTLPPGYKTAFHLYCIEGYMHTEIAEFLLLTESTSKSQFFRARKTLRKMLSAG